MPERLRTPSIALASSCVACKSQFEFYSEVFMATERPRQAEGAHKGTDYCPECYDDHQDEEDGDAEPD